MSELHLIDSVADTTSHRDRDDLDHSVARLLLQFFDAQAVKIYHLSAGAYEDSSARRVIGRVTLTRAGQVPPDIGPELSKAPRLDDLPAWNECVSKRQLVEYPCSGGVGKLFPIDGEREVTGVLAIETASGLTARDTSLVGGILKIVKNHLALLDYGQRDTLTGLLNRKSFESTFYKLLQRVERGDADSEPSWMGVIDIDKFKSINDNFGHVFGDEVLLLVSQLMKKNFRGADLLFRFGGEEFVVVLDAATAPGAQIAFERLRAAVAGNNFPQVGQVTISIGFTQIEPLDAPGTCIERADAALYYAKNHGRNNVRHHEVLIASGELKSNKKSGEIELF